MIRLNTPKYGLIWMKGKHIIEIGIYELNTHEILFLTTKLWQILVLNAFMMPKSRLGDMKINIIVAKSRQKWVESQKFAKVQFNLRFLKNEIKEKVLLSVLPWWIQMRKKIVMGVDLGFRRLISTSAYYGFGDEMMLYTIKDDFNQAENWIAEQILRGSAWLHGWAKEQKANVIALEDLKINHLDVNENMKEVLKALVNKIEEDSFTYETKVEFVSPIYTSKQCSNCGKMGYRVGMKFGCPYCRYEENSGVNAARNIGIRYIIKQIISDLNARKNPWDKYYFATLYGPKLIDELGWVRSSILSVPGKTKI